MVTTEHEPTDTADTSLREALEIAKQCEEAAQEIAGRWPVAARLLMQEAAQWRGWP